MKNIVIIGSGIGGLCSAVRLLSRGFQVTILEKEDTIGGKVNRKEVNGFKFDLTASILMTPHIYTDIFTYAGRDYRDYFEIFNLDSIYNVFYSDKTNYLFCSDLKKMTKVLNNIESGLSDKYEYFLYNTLNKYHIINNEFLHKPMISIKEVINIHSLKLILKANPIQSSSRYISSIIQNEKLRQYLIFQAMYMGINPYTNTNLYSMIPAISHAYGLAYIKGGVYQYISSLERLIYELGGEIKTNTEVNKIAIEDNKIIGVKTDKKFYKSDYVICNADYPYAVKKLLPLRVAGISYSRKNIDRKEYSCSVFIIYLGLDKKYEQLKVHNIYINKKFKKSIEDAFNGKIPKHPSIYMYYPSNVDNSLCGKSKSILNIMVRVPNLSFDNMKWNRRNIIKYRNKIIKEISNIQGLEDIEKHIECEGYLTPEDLEKKFNAYKGNAFGLSHKLSQDIYLRPHIKSSEVRGLYFIGSSTHPGNGVSIIIDGTKVLTDIIIEDCKK